MKLHTIIIVIAAAILPACTSGVPMTVTAIADPDADLAAIQSFDLIQTNGSDALLEKNLMRLVQRELSARGYTYDTASPDVLIAVAGSAVARREYVPPTTTYSPYYEPGDSYSIRRTRSVNGRIVTYHDRVRTRGGGGDWVYVPRTNPGYERTVYQKSIVIRMLDAGDTTSSDVFEINAIAVWEGRAVTTDTEPDILRLAPLMIREALSEFPTPTGKPSRRDVQSEPDQKALRAPNG